jgi:feruloyl esterase
MIFTLCTFLLPLVAGAVCVSASNPTAQQCSDLIKNLNLPPSVKILFTTAYPDNSTIVDPTDLSFPQPAVELPALCRVSANISTSPTSRTLFEVWLPLNTWNDRYLTIGNGGGAGGINYAGMGVGVRKGECQA